ncbi:MAG: hypothetical protein JXR96_28350 [Deltaproteobacteria bacterium]|nr:hypothetical protein [Deltaproteobacteria bacterium]
MRRAAIGLSACALLSLAGCKTGWLEESSPTDADLYAVFGVPDGDVYAVGVGGTVLRRSGGSWYQLDSGIEDDLYGVWGTSDEHVVVVGANCTALEFNGEPEPPDGGEAPPDMRALEVSGCERDGDPQRVLRNIDGPDASRAYVTCEPPGHNLFVYSEGSISAYGSSGVRLLGVSYPVSGRLYLSGEEGLFDVQGDEPWQTRIRLCPVELVDGTCPLPEEEQALPILWDVWVGEGGQGAAVGSFGGVWLYPPPEEGFWEAIDTGIDGDLRGVHGFEKSDGTAELYAIGNYGAIFRVRDGEAKRQVSGTKEQLYGVWASPDGSQAYAVGAAGTILHLHN